MATSSEFVTLKGGFTLPVAVVTYLLDCEDRGLRFRVLPDGRLHVAPHDAIRDTDRAFIAQHRDLLRACITYIDDIAGRPL